tara:strand:- start:315 stop:497 length:183 start_codon:yes stop_codon:yes gene_type:complete
MTHAATVFPPPLLAPPPPPPMVGAPGVESWAVPRRANVHACCSGATLRCSTRIGRLDDDR